MTDDNVTYTYIYNAKLGAYFCQAPQFGSDKNYHQLVVTPYFFMVSMAEENGAHTVYSFAKTKSQEVNGFGDFLSNSLETVKSKKHFFRFLEKNYLNYPHDLLQADGTIIPRKFILGSQENKLNNYNEYRASCNHLLTLNEKFVSEKFGNGLKDLDYISTLELA